MVNDKRPIAGSLAGRFTRDVIYNVGALGVLALAGVLANFAIVRWSGYAALGVFGQVYFVFVVASQLATGGLHYSVLHHLSRTTERGTQERAIVSQAIQAAVLLATAVAVLAYAAAPALGEILDSEQVGAGIRIMAPGLVFFAFNKVALLAVNARRQMRAYASFQSARALLLLIVVLVVIAQGRPASHLAACFTLSEAALGIALYPYLHLRVAPIRLPYRFGKWTRRHFSFGARGFMSGLLTEMNTRVDIFMLGIFVGDARVGVYVLPAMLAEGVAQLPHVVRQNLDPIIGRAFAAGRRHEIEDAAVTVRRRFWPWLLLLIALATLAFPIVIATLTGRPGVGESWTVFAILMLGVAVASGFRPLQGAFVQGGAPGINSLLIALVLLSNIALNAMLIPLMGIYGAALGTAVALGLEAALIVWFARRFLAVNLLRPSA